MGSCENKIKVLHMGFHGDLMGFHGDLMGFHGDLMGFRNPIKSP